MSYDVEAEPTSVTYQRRLEALLNSVREELTNQRLVGLAVLTIIVYGAMTGDFSQTTASTASSTSSALEGLTPSEIVDAAWKYALVIVGAVVIISLHEATHAFAFDHFGVEPQWTISWVEVRGKPLVILPPLGGVCWPKHDYQSVWLSYREDAIVSLAPLVLTAASLVVVGAYHLFVDPFTSLLWASVAVLFLTGPSPPDYGALLTTPRERWEALVEWDDQLTTHAAAEGFPASTARP